MKKLILISMLLFGCANQPTYYSDTNPDLVYVNGYYRKSGTYVAPYARTAPDGYKYNNLRRR